jgi:hypothetical protein
VCVCVCVRACVCGVCCRKMQGAYSWAWAATEQEVQRNSDEANLVGVRTYKLKYAWISDRLKLERERGISTYIHLVGGQFP